MYLVLLVFITIAQYHGSMTRLVRLIIDTVQKLYKEIQTLLNLTINTNKLWQMKQTVRLTHVCDLCLSTSVRNIPLLQSR